MNEIKIKIKPDTSESEIKDLGSSKSNSSDNTIQSSTLESNSKETKNPESSSSAQFKTPNYDTSAVTMHTDQRGYKSTNESLAIDNSEETAAGQDNSEKRDNKGGKDKIKIKHKIEIKTK